ncbi:MAG: hypothetical protein J5762_03955 [Clostridia bacterium]|nr:hypothetical protein [Clostridia bacterium]
MGVSIRYPSKRKKTVKLNEFFHAPDSRIDPSFIPARPSDCYNFALNSGALKDGFGIKPLSFSSAPSAPTEISGKTIKKAYFYRKFDADENSYDDQLLVWCQSGELYKLSLNGGSAFVLLNKTFDSAPKGLNYRLNGEDVFIFSDENAVVVYDGTNFFSYTAPQITSMCMHAERLFVTTGGEETTLWFSDNFDPTNWYVSLDAAGFIDFRDGLGKVDRVIDFDGKVFVFRDVGITRLQGYLDQQEFYAESVPVAKEKIYSDTVTDCGKRVIYLTAGGFYSFDGYNAVRIMPELDGFLKGVDNGGSHGVYHNGNFYCSVKLNMGKTVETRVVCYNVTDKRFYLAKGFSPDDMLHIPDREDKLLFVTEGKLGEIDELSRYFGVPLRKVWRNNPGSFGVAGEKILQKINLATDGDLTVRIASDYGEKVVNVKGSDIVGTYPVGLKGNKFSVTIESRIVGAAVSDVSIVLLY